MTIAPWTGEQCRDWLFADYHQLQQQLPRVIETSRRLDDAQRADALMDAIDAACAYADNPERAKINSSDELRNVLWSCCRRTVLHQLDGRYNTVRAGYIAEPDTALDTHASNDPVPDEALIAGQDARLAHELAASLQGDLARAFHAMYSGPHVLGERRLASALGVSPKRGKQLHRHVVKALEQFAELAMSDQLCRTRKIQIGDTLTGRADATVIRTVKAHVAHCPSCRQDLATLKRHVHSARFGRKVAGLLPIPATTGNDRHGRLRDWMLDLLGRHSDSAAAATTQLVSTGAGRLGGQLAACVSGIAAAALCAGALVAGPLAPDKRDARPETAAQATPTPAATINGPIATREPDPIVTATPTAKPKKRSSSRSSSPSRSSRASDPDANQQALPAQPAVPGSLPNGASEFGPSSANDPAASAPADTASGASEFGP